MMEGSEAAPMTTTISTIAVQSGSTKIVIALLQSREWLELRVVEMTPSLTQLGSNLAEATALLAAHDQVLAKIHSKQSPVEELLRQADQLIASQHTRAEVYAAMAESLSLAWQDINTLLQRRKEILELNVKYHSDAAVCLERTRALELACNNAPLPIEVPELRDLLSRLSDVKRAMLESLMAALQDGRALLDNLRQIAAEGSLDSRPGQTKASTETAIAQVERWLEELHDRRRTLEVSWQTRKTQLEQCLALALLATDLRLLETAFAERMEAAQRHTAELGDSAASAQLLLTQHSSLLPEAKELQEQGLKILRATEQLAATGHFAGEDAIAQAYHLLNTSTEYQELLEQREQSLHDAIAFFTDAQNILSKLDKLEGELSKQNTEIEVKKAQELLKSLCGPVLQQGYNLLESIPGAKGVQNTVEVLENRKLQVGLRCSAALEDNIKVFQAYNNFLEKHNQLQLWLVNTAQGFILGHQDMGSVLAVAKAFLQKHHDMLNDLQVKGTEINALLKTVPDLLTTLDETRRVEVEEKAESLHSQWISLKQVLDKRTELATLYVKFHTLIVELAAPLDSLTGRLNDKPSETERTQLEEQYNTVTQLFVQLGTVADNFKQDSLTSPEPLSTERARLCVDTLRQHFSDRVANLRTLWLHWEEHLDTARLNAQHWAINMTESIKTVDWVTKLDGQLYPVLVSSQTSAKGIVRELEETKDRTLTEIKRAQEEVQLRITTAEQILSQEPNQTDSDVLSQLRSLQQRLQQVVTDYQILIEMFISFFKNLSELEHTVHGLEGQYGATPDSTTLVEVEKSLREHDASRQAIQELFKFAHTESLQIINKIRHQEPGEAADKDVDKVRLTLEELRSAWERAWGQHRVMLEAKQQLAQFDADLSHIHASLDELSQQLAKVKGQFGEDLAAANATSLAFHYFEKTIQLLEQRIETFMGAGDAMLKSKHASSPHIQQELISLRTRWHQFQQQVSDTRCLIDLSLEYFTLVQEAEDWFREGSRLLMAIAKKSSSIKKPEEATELLQEIELFLKPGEVKQDERIQKISDLAVKLFGSGQPDQLHQVRTESKEMIDSFSQVSLELQQIVNFLNKPPEEQQMEIVGLQEALPLDDETPPSRKSPSPPPKKAKVEDEQQEVESQPPNFTLPLHDATIDEGSRFTFECRMSGVPMPEITWLKDNLSIDSNLDYHTSVSPDGLCLLTIEETFTEDSACFTCRATNELGYAETTALLTVRENERETPPVFVRTLVPTVCREGSSMSLICKVEGTPLPTVQWYKDGVCVDTSPNYTTTYNNGEAVLSVDSLKPEDQGLYSCKATNRLGSESTAASLTVESNVSEKAPVFVTPLSNVMARTGQKIRLECEVSGIPEPRVEWTHNGKPLPDTRDIKMHYEGGKIVLTIAEAFPKDAGIYTLTASNGSGCVTGSCSVAVKGRLPTETSDSELASDLEPSKPSVLTALRDTEVIEGAPIRLDCVIVGQPEPEVIWYHEGAPVKESKEVQLLFQGDRCSLIITEALPEDTGVYKAVAVNSAGEATSSCRLTVIRAEEPQQVVEGTKPQFISLLTDALATEGDSITLECAVSGAPAPTVTWHLNNIPLSPSERIKPEHEPGGLCKLTITPVGAEDKGVYTAKATNPLGEAKCFAHLIVKGAANLASATEVADTMPEERPVSTMPCFTELFADRTVVDGNTTKFECIVTGKPTPKVRWLYNDEPVSGKDFLVSVSGSRQVLAIPTVSRSLDGGKITCTAENEAGKASCTASLNVVDAPPVDALMSSIDQMNLSESSVFELKREVFMQSSTHSQFGSGEPKVQIHGRATRTEQTSQKIGDKPAVQVESTKISEYHSVDGVEERMDTQSQSSTSEQPGVLVPVRAPPQRKHVAPRFTAPVMGKIVDQGSDVMLQGIVEGYPAPTVSWARNGKEVQENERIKMKRELNKAELKLEGVKAEDAGKYSCVAENSAGTATCTADLVVKKNVFPPVFGRRLQADMVVAGQRAVLEVEVTGTPDPTVTWFKDGNEIATSSSMFRLVAQGNSHRLVIEQAGLSHSGRYEVQAVNGGGEARSAADLLIVEPPEVHPSPLQPSGVEMDLPESTDISPSTHLVSITESYKSDKKISIHVEHSTASSDPLFDLPFLNVKPQEPQSSILSKPLFDLPSLSKPQELPQSTFSKQSESLQTQEENITFTKPAQFILPTETPVVQPQCEESTAIEDTSISKKSALSFFKNIIKENEEEAKISKPADPAKKPEPILAPQPILYQSPLESTMAHPVTEFTQPSVQESLQRFDSIYTSDGFFLQPEPPPELGFISKAQVPKGKEQMADRVKKLEESHRALSEDQIPSGGVKIFPTPTQSVSSSEISTQTKTFSPPEENISSHTISTQTSFKGTIAHHPMLDPTIESSSFSETKCEKSFLPEVQHEAPVIKPVPFNVYKFEPSKKECTSETFNSFQAIRSKSELLNGEDFGVHKFESLGPIVRPSADIQLRPQSPRPSAEGISMEKLWTSKKHEDYVELPHGSPTLDYSTPIQQSQEQTSDLIQQYTSEKTSTFKETFQTLSPLPSSTGLVMEKLWSPTVDYQRPLSSLSIGERPKSPSAEGLAMDKIWAHKSSTHKKVWPPPQKEESQPTPLWVNKTNDEVPPVIADSSAVPVQKECYTDSKITFESQSFSNVQNTPFQSSKFSENVFKPESAFREVTSSKQVKPYIPPSSVPPESKIIYVAETHASHSINLPEPQSQYLTTETNYLSSSQTIEKTQRTISDSTIIEEKVLRPSEAVKKWPPFPKEVPTDFQPSLQKQEFQSFQKQEIKKEFSSTIPSDSGWNDIPLQPGPPPEIAFAEPPPRRQSYVETIEQDLEKNIDKVPSRHLAGAVRIIPPPLKKKEHTSSSESSSQSKIIQNKKIEKEKKVYVPESINKPLPKLEPFPYKPDPPRNKPSKCPPPPRPSRFVKGSFTESDYESDCDSVRIPVKWNPWQSDSEDYSYRKVKPPSVVHPVKRPHSATSQPLPPSEFEKPPTLQGPTKSIVTQHSEVSKSAKSKLLKTEETLSKTFSSKESKFVQNKPQGIKPGSPPQFVESAPKYKQTANKPGSPKTKPKVVQPVPPESGYMADTDEPPQQHKLLTSRTEESVVIKSEQLTTLEQTRLEKKTSFTSGSNTFEKKELSKSEFQSLSQRKDDPALEPFPFKVEPVRPSKRPLGPPPPSPSKFIKGEFRESDYESEYEGKIRPIWRPTDPPEDLTFRPVKPVLTPVSGRTQNAGKTPTPPTEFEEPPSFSGPPRPKFEPIDKPKTTTKEKEVTIEKTKLIKPKAVQAQAPSPIETIYATPASKPFPDFILKPGSPPKMDYAPPPGFVEKSNIVNFTESTGSSKRVVSVQQTTRVMQFGSSSQKQVRKENIPPMKFVPAFSKESDYESDVDGVVSKPLRTPLFDAESKRLKRVEEMKRKFLESEPSMQPGEPPQFAYSPDPSKVAYSAASRQISEMTQTFKGKTQKFVSDVLSDIKTSQQKSGSDKSILKPAVDEPQTYRDENRLSEYGTKHIDPDTGLIYFKYDFGYEFGIVLPGEQKPGTHKSVVSGPTKKEEGAIDFPVIHETTQKKKPNKAKTVKWEPTSESEMSEIESERIQRGPQAKFTLQTPSPHSRTPSVQSISPYPTLGHDSTGVSPGSPWLGTDSSQVVRAVSPGELPKKSPLFITPLRDIACVSGQPARFECIVLAEPVPSITWIKDGVVLRPSADHVIEYRNGVCRLTLPQAKPCDAGQYTCSASNPLGSAQTLASLQVPGERRSLYK